MSKLIEKEVEKSFKIINDGGIILYPTETIWGIGCDATKTVSVEKLFNIKNRSMDKPMLSLVSDIDMVDCSYNALKLAYKIMAADGVVDPQETKLINNIAKALNLDSDEVAKIRDKNILGLEEISIDKDNVLESLGIDSSLDNSAIKKKLAMEFQKWNNRLNTVPSEEREEVQKMLDKIALSRKNYD